MKKGLRSTALALTAVLAVTGLSACGSKGDSKEATTAKSAEADFTYTGAAPVTKTPGAKVSILAQNSWYSTVDYANADIVKKIQENAGVTVDWTLVSPVNYKDSVSPMLASGTDLPNIVQLPDLDNNMTYITAGLFYPLDEYMDHMPNYKKYLDENPGIKASLTAEDGHIYYLPQTAVTNNYQPCIMINMEWLKKLNLPVPSTLDEFVEVLRAFKANDMNGDGDVNDEIPLSVTADRLSSMFGPAFGLPAMFGPSVGLDPVSSYYADDDGKVHYAPAESEKYKKYVTFLNQLYKEGLLEVEYTSLTRDQITQRCAQNRTGATFDFSWQMSQLYSKQYPEYNGENGVMVGIPPLSGDYKGVYLGRTPISGIFGVSTSDKDPILAMRFLDYAMSEEAQNYYVWGIEGESYTVGADGKKSYTEKAADNNWLQQLGINAGCLPSQQSVEATDVLLPKWHVDVDKELQSYIRDPWPFIYSTKDEQNIIAQYQTDLTTYVAETNVAFITGTTSLDSFDSYLSTLDSMGLKDLLKVKQQQYDRFKASK